MAQMTKEEAINHILSINSHVKRKGDSDVCLYETALLNDRTGRGVRVIKKGKLTDDISELILNYKILK